MPLLSSSHRLASPCRPHHGSPPGAHRSGGAGHPVGLSSPRPGSGCGPAGRLAGSRARNPRAGASETSPASSFSPFWALQKLLALPEALHGNRSSRPASPNGARGASPEGLRGPQGGSAGSRRGPLRHGDPQPISGTPALGAAAPPPAPAPWREAGRGFSFPRSRPAPPDPASAAERARGHVPAVPTMGTGREARPRPPPAPEPSGTAGDAESSSIRHPWGHPGLSLSPPQLSQTSNSSKAAPQLPSNAPRCGDAAPAALAHLSSVQSRGPCALGCCHGARWVLLSPGAGRMKPQT